MNAQRAPLSRRARRMVRAGRMLAAESPALMPVLLRGDNRRARLTPQTDIVIELTVPDLARPSAERAQSAALLREQLNREVPPARLAAAGRLYEVVVGAGAPAGRG